jgi:hypothetical protein
MSINFGPLEGMPRMDKNMRWPDGGRQFCRFLPNYDYSPHDHYKQGRHFEQEMRRAFEGRRVSVLDHELKSLTFYVPRKTEATGACSEPRTSLREFFKLEMDAWIKEPDPVVTLWEKFKLWLCNKPMPKAPEPDRVIVYYSMSRNQASIFRRLLVDDFA